MLNATRNRKPKSKNQWLLPMGLINLGKTSGVTGMGPDLARQPVVCRVFGLVWNWTDQSLLSVPRLLVGYPEPLLKLVLRQTSPDLLSIEECPSDILQTLDFSCCSPLFNPVNDQTTWGWLTASPGTVRNPCNLQLYAVGFVLSRKCKLAITHYILTWCWLYIPQDFPFCFMIIYLFFSTTANHGSAHTSTRWE